MMMGLQLIWGRNGSVESIKSIVKALSDAKLDERTGKSPQLQIRRFKSSGQLLRELCREAQISSYPRTTISTASDD